MPYVTGVQFSTSIIESLDEELDDFIEQCEPSMAGMRDSNWASHGGNVRASVLPSIFDMLPRAKSTWRGASYFADFGCGMGQAVLLVLTRFPQLKVYGVDCDRRRLDVVMRRVQSRGVSAQFHSVEEDWTISWQCENRWRWMTNGRGVIFVNNINFGGDVNCRFESVVLTYAGTGTIIISCSPLFIGGFDGEVERVTVPGSTKRGGCELEVPAGGVTWTDSGISLHVYIYRVLVVR